MHRRRGPRCSLAGSGGDSELERADLEELHYIAAVENLASILERGILCYNLVAKLQLAHRSVADPDVQARRNKKVPQGFALHDYVNLYKFAKRWTHPDDYVEQLKHGSAMCAEVLVPQIVELQYVETLYVANVQARATVLEAATIAGIPVVVRPYLFFEAAT